MKLRVWIGIAMLLCAFTVVASGGTRSAVRKQAEMSMLVTGEIDIEKDGSVGAHRIDQPDKLPPVVVRLIGEAMPQWRFEPVVVDGKIVRARTKMSLRLVAKRKDDGNYLLRIGSATFGDESPGVTVRGKMRPPRYPESAYRAGVQGTAYLILKIDRQGKVDQVVDEQVNLTVVGNERQMRQGRKLLADAAKAAAREWEFDIPTEGEAADDPYWSIRVPVSFALCDSRSECQEPGKAAYGTWEAYIPGPRNPVPWRTEGTDPGSDALADGALHLVGSGPKLLTQLGEG